MSLPGNILPRYCRLKEKDIWVTVYHEDDEAFDLWKKYIGIPESKIIRLNKEHNFWGPAGSAGPCGPCSELYLDRGPEFDQCKQPGDQGERFLEFWNLVFNQYHQDEQHNLSALNQTGIDTGAGLERLATLIQKVDSVYDTDELKKLKNSIIHSYGITSEQPGHASICILTDHIRTLTFAISDGIYPSNEARGYVLRRILRRAMLYARKLGRKEPSLYKFIDDVVQIYGKFYTELKKEQSVVESYVKEEESRFIQTLELGEAKLEEILHESKSQNNRVISGKNAFLLYDTFGFPLEMTVELAEQQKIRVDIPSFEEEMEKQKQRGRIAWKGDVSKIPLYGLSEVRFTGYEKLKDETMISRIIYKEEILDQIDSEKLANAVRTKNDTKSDQDIFYLVTSQTPFYPEGGGQIADQGTIKGEGFEAEVIDTQKFEGIIFHTIRNLRGSIQVNQKVTLEVNEGLRNSIKRNHSATHLLNSALMKIFGSHVRQSGSLVHDQYLRFDFTHHRAMNFHEMRQIENLVNDAVERSDEVKTLVLPKSEAEKRGAVMTFGEKYGDTVRVVEMGDFSMEFCGGTHVGSTKEIGLFLIVKENSPGAGNRRIEAVSGKHALDRLQLFMKNSIDLLNRLSNELKSSKELKAPDQVQKKNHSFQLQIEEFQKNVQRMVNDQNSKAHHKWDSLRYHEL